MRLSEFLKTHAEEILLEWDKFAKTVQHEGVALDQKEQRDHAGQILREIATDLERPQSDAQQVAKSKGKSDTTDSEPATAAETHADARMISGFAVDAMITEYRALRASVVRLWVKSGKGKSQSDDTEQLIRFNEAIDQAITESVKRFTTQTRKSTDLFIGILGHDIRNPLGTIGMSAEYLIRSGKLDAKSAQPIVNSVARITSVIEHVVDFTRAQSEGLMPIRPKRGNLAHHFQKLIEGARVRSPDTDLRLRVDGDFDGNWDEGRMGQLLSNLMGNAILYGARDSAVTVRMWQEDGQHAFSVHNFGGVIPARERKRIFEPLVRGISGGKQERREPSGLGLGLYICREIVRAMGGTIEVDSEKDEGTTFTVKLKGEPPAAVQNEATQ